MPFFPPRIWDAEDRIVLGYISRPFGLSVHVLGNVSPQHSLGGSSPWTLSEEFNVLIIPFTLGFNDPRDDTSYRALFRIASSSFYTNFSPPSNVHV